MRKKTVFMVCFLLALTLFTTGCGKEKADLESKGTETIIKDSLVFGMPAEVQTLDPAKIYSFRAWSVFNQIYEPLIKSCSDGTLEPGLAESWDISDDGTEVVFHLRQGVKFHNGETMTADDVAFSLNRAIESPNLTSINSAMDKAEIIDDGTVKLTLKYPFSAIESCVGHANMSIVNKKAVEDDPEKFERNPVGTGPYYLADWKTGDKYVFESFKDYWKGEAEIKHLTFKIVLDGNTAIIALENGEIDILDAPPASERNRLVNNNDIQYHETEMSGSFYIAINNQRSPLSDPKVRRAISYGIDKEAMMIAASDGVGAILDCFPAKAAFGYPDDVKGNPHDPEKAKQLLTESGYPDGFDISIITDTDPKYYKPSEVLQDSLKKIGINAELDVVDLNQTLIRVRQERDFELHIDGTSAPYLDCNYIYGFFHGDQIGKGQNYFGCDNKELNDLLDRGRVSQDSEERKTIYKRVCEIINEEAIAIPIYSGMQAVAATKDLKGVQPNPMARYYIYDYSW
ncbi:MAG: ABC transporter substrate-binding protein [Firmicutes bacterium]|nr:ABC transporter substrate-binding protein [Bacillota bacterium]